MEQHGKKTTTKKHMHTLIQNKQVFQVFSAQTHPHFEALYLILLLSDVLGRHEHTFTRHDCRFTWALMMVYGPSPPGSWLNSELLPPERQTESTVHGILDQSKKQLI